MKFLAARFANGKAAVANFLNDKHRYFTCQNALSEAHADLITFQSAAGAPQQPLLDITGSRKSL